MGYDRIHGHRGHPENKDKTMNRENFEQLTARLRAEDDILRNRAAYDVKLEVTYLDGSEGPVKLDGCYEVKVAGFTVGRVSKDRDGNWVARARIADDRSLLGRMEVAEGGYESRRDAVEGLLGLLHRQLDRGYGIHGWRVMSKTDVLTSLELADVFDAATMEATAFQFGDR